jgi:3-phenylpropionate/trans-cinnamate dioxygenase ferredoxin reductase subunit
MKPSVTLTAALKTFADWQEPNNTGVIYYLDGGRVHGAMMCNVWDKIDAARALIRKTEPMRIEELRGAIRVTTAFYPL